MHQTVRWVQNKEKHADDAAHIITYYFMAQRVKPVDRTETEDYHKYVKKLTLLPAGLPPPNPSELLSSEKMRLLIAQLKARYHDRYIVIDATPAQLAAETAFLANAVDGVLLVVRSGQTPKKAILAAIDNIGREKILGLVFNASNENKKIHQTYYRRYQQK